jgi:hypothetical protein
MRVEVGVGRTIGVVVVVMEVAGRMCLVVVAGALLRHYTKLGSGMAVMVAGAAGMDRAMHMIAAVLLAGRTEGMAAVVVVGSWAVVAHKDLKGLHYSSNSFRCLDMQVHQRGSEGRRLM